MCGTFSRWNAQALLAAVAMSAFSSRLFADAPSTTNTPLTNPATSNPTWVAPTPGSANPSSGDATSNRYGLLGLLDHRSIYGKYWFPEPLSADESDVDNEIRADWTHTEKSGHQNDEIRAELEKSFGLLTLEIAPSYESDRMATFNPVTRKTERDNQSGMGNVELGARHPLFQYVSPNQIIDSTVVFGMEVTVPTGSVVSKDWELVPKLFDLTRIGDHFSVQLGLGDSILVGPEGRGLSTLEYNMTLGYELTKKELPIPGLLSTVAIFELNGENTLNQDEAGHNVLSATAGFRFNFDSIPWLPAQPRLGIGYTFPIDHGARDDFRWGIVTSVVFEY